MTHNRPRCITPRLACSLAARFAAFALLIASAAPPAAAQPDSTTLSGIANPSQRVTLKTPLDGVLRELLVSTGDRVEADQRIARIEDGPQRAAVRVARLRAEGTAELRSAQLALEEARIAYERFLEAYEKDAASDWEIRRAKLRRDQAEAQLDSLKEQKALAAANLELELEKLDRYSIDAPFAGQIVHEAAEVGQTLAHTDPLVELVALDPLEASFNLPAEMSGRIRVGQRVRLVAGVPVSAELVGTVDTAIPVIDPASRTFRCTVKIENPGREMPAGFDVTLVPPGDETD